MRPQGGSEWHGYAITWDDLKADAKNNTMKILKKNGIVNAKGKIL